MVILSQQLELIHGIPVAAKEDFSRDVDLGCLVGGERNQGEVAHIAPRSMDNEVPESSPGTRSRQVERWMGNLLGSIEVTLHRGLAILQCSQGSGVGIDQFSEFSRPGHDGGDGRKVEAEDQDNQSTQR